VYHDPYQQRPPQHPPPQPSRPYKSVERTRGLGGCANSTHLTLTICTCGLWGVVWFVWWVFRVVIPRKRVTKHYR
jgi:hypothetical protein